MAAIQDHAFMARALHLAAKGLYTTAPNPRVGCVIAQGEVIVGEGFHQRAGEAHAEVLALQQAGEKAQGATAYVTLEPCSHHGRTPPCCDALIAAGVERVVIAMEDPNPQVSGQGAARLEQHGIAVTSGLMQSEAEKLNRGFFKRMRTGLPWVRIKMAMSLDGRTAMLNGESQWITGEAARQDVQKLRAQAGAVITSVGTVLHDNPSLNLRLDAEALGISVQPRQPLRVILDADLQTPPESKLLQLLGETLIFHGGRQPQREESLRQSGAGLETVVANASSLDLRQVLLALASRDINECHVEAGATLSGALLAEGLVDELFIYMAPHLMGDSARGLFHLPELKQMSQRLQLTIEDIRRIGDDWRITARPKNNQE